MFNIGWSMQKPNYECGWTINNKRPKRDDDGQGSHVYNTKL